MNLIELKIPLSKRRDFSLLVISLEITVILSFSNADFLGDTYIDILCCIDETDIPAQLKEEKLKERFGKYIC